jgi:hypothetical protein
MRRYFDEIGISGMRLAERYGVSHSQIYMARTRNFGAGNAKKISRGVTLMLGLPEERRLELKAEIMGHLGELVHAWIGGPVEAQRLFRVSYYVALEIVGEERFITHSGGARALEALRQMGAPDTVIASVERRLKPPPSHGPGSARTTFVVPSWPSSSRGPGKACGTENRRSTRRCGRVA